MNKIVREYYPASHLPEELREGINPNAEVKVTIEEVEPRPDHVMTLDEIFAARRPPYRTPEEIDANIRSQRDDWDD
jgi:hypothetical protein